jgi:hypothetical protein
MSQTVASGLMRSLASDSGARFLLGDQAFLRRALDVLKIVEAEGWCASALRALHQHDVRLGEIHARGFVERQRREQLFVGQLQTAGDRERDFVARVAGRQQRARQPRRVVLRPGEQEDVRVLRDGAHGWIQPVRRRRAGEPLAGVLAVARGDGDVLPRLPEARAGELERRDVGQDLEWCVELVAQPGGDAVAERIAGGEDGDGTALGERGLRPCRHPWSARRPCPSVRPWTRSHERGRAYARRR